MPRPIDITVEDELAKRLEVLNPEHPGRQSIVDDALAMVDPESQPVVPPVVMNDLYDEQLRKLIDAVTLE